MSDFRKNDFWKNIKSWTDLDVQLKEISDPQKKGEIFEVFSKALLKTHPSFSAKEVYCPIKDAPEEVTDTPHR